MTHKPLPILEADIVALISKVETADDPNVPFTLLKVALSEHLARSRDLREEWHRQWNTIVRQAATIAENEIDALIGERAPTPGESHHLQPQNFPDVITMDSAQTAFSSNFPMASSTSCTSPNWT